MIPSLHNGVSALKSLTEGLQILGNNIANVNSLGYKAARANYSDNFYMHLNDAEAGANGVPSNNIQQHGTGVHIGSISTDFNQGTHETTGLDLDLAIQGEALPNGGGFFEVVDDNTGEIFYTRAGAFEANERELVVTRDQFEYKLQGSKGDIDLSKFIPPEPKEYLLCDIKFTNSSLNFDKNNELYNKTNSFLQVRKKIEKYNDKKYQSYYYLLD